MYLDDISQRIEGLLKTSNIAEIFKCMYPKFFDGEELKW